MFPLVFFEAHVVLIARFRSTWSPYVLHIDTFPPRVFLQPTVENIERNKHTHISHFGDARRLSPLGLPSTVLLPRPSPAPPQRRRALAPRPAASSKPPGPASVACFSPDGRHSTSTAPARGAPTEGRHVRPTGQRAYMFQQIVQSINSKHSTNYRPHGFVLTLFLPSQQRIRFT